MQTASVLPASLAALVHVEHEWVRCNACDEAFWNRANVTAVVRAKAQRHARKAHGAALGGRPERRGAAVEAQPLDLVALGTALAKAAEMGALRHLGGGVFRQGYGVERSYVIKLASRRDGRDCNLAEATTWASAPAALRKWLCPVVAVAPNGAWVMMRYAERVGGVGMSDYAAVKAAMRRYIGDLHGGNVGMIDGQPVITDYACGQGHGQPADWQNGRGF